MPRLQGAAAGWSVLFAALSRYQRSALSCTAATWYRCWVWAAPQLGSVGCGAFSSHVTAKLLEIRELSLRLQEPLGCSDCCTHPQVQEIGAMHASTSRKPSGWSSGAAGSLVFPSHNTGSSELPKPPWARPSLRLKRETPTVHRLKQQPKGSLHFPESPFSEQHLELNPQMMANNNSAPTTALFLEL